ncbi:CoA transferase [Sphingosinicella sp. LY1275]|uniref:CaiB/BaiF CoA transferase family protein n=1 Tax=Sphingosinicella sp. LY1275 TaxID=3095379 RepID=UPI002ADED189|nr:CoA transferase [Sphingosinicella sp. LY1275]MEA1015751.1 CoA transferase [Sphingosinicella sp. LY1275]
MSVTVSPLAGVKILDFSHILAGPYCTRLLADFGAEVIKVESRTRPDMTGALKPGEKVEGRQDRPPLFLNINRSKQSITLNLKTEQGREIATRLAAQADVVVENFSSRVMARLGLDYASLSAINPRLIYLSLSGYGHTGPRKEWTSMNMNLQAHSGLMLATGEEGGPPVAISNSWNDYVGGIHGAFAVIEVLSERRKTGQGANLDVSQFECSVSTLGGLLAACSVNQRQEARPGNRCSYHAPQGLYRCAGEDEWCAIVVENDSQWRSLRALIGHSDMSDPTLDEVQGRQDAAAGLDVIIEAWTSTQDSHELERLLRGAGVCAQRMNRIADVMCLPEAERVFPVLDDPGDIPRRVCGLPIRWESLRSEMRPAPRVGQHTKSVLSDWLGLSPDQIEDLDRDGALR